MINTYNDFIEVLRRAQTFSRLVLYNRQTVDPYFLAALGFIKVDSPDKRQQNKIQVAKCQECRCLIRFDSLTSDFQQSKQPLKYAVRNHKQDCIYNSIKQQGANPQLNTKTVSEYGHQLYKHIMKQYHQNVNRIESININFQELFKLLNKNQRQCINYFWRSSSSEKRYEVLSLFGWSYSENENSLKCRYCGATKKINQQLLQFDYLNNHYPTCLLIFKERWRTILKKIVIQQVKDTDGQFLKNQSMKSTKQLRDSLKTITDSKKQIFDHMREKMKVMSEERIPQNERMQPKIRMQDQLLRVFDRVSSITDELQDQFESISKKIKYQ